MKLTMTKIGISRSDRGWKIRKGNPMDHNSENVQAGLAEEFSDAFPDVKDSSNDFLRM